jgi:hypothetical protein
MRRARGARKRPADGLTHRKPDLLGDFLNEFVEFSVRGNNGRFDDCQEGLQQLVAIGALRRRRREQDTDINKKRKNEKMSAKL